MEVFVHSRHTPLSKIEKKYPEAKIIDATSRGEEPFVKLSPFYPLGGIPIPFSDGYFAQSVEGIWQGLKVFENHGINLDSFENTSMKGIKRTVRKYGNVRGHQAGLNSGTLLSYADARKQIYLPIYLWALENKLGDVLELLKEYLQAQNLVLLDYETNGDVDNLAKPLSHAYLVKYYLENKYPDH